MMRFARQHWPEYLIESALLGIFMVQTPSQRGRIQLALKTLIYQAMGR